MKKGKNHVDSVLDRQDLVLAVPVALIDKAGGLPQAVFIRQAAFLTALKCRNGGNGFFNLPAEGRRDPNGTNIFARIGSWRALGINRHSLKLAKRRAEELGLLEAVREGANNCWHYRIDLDRYSALMSELGIVTDGMLGARDCMKLVSGNTLRKSASSTAENRSADCRKRQRITESGQEFLNKDSLVSILMDHGVSEDVAMKWWNIRKCKQQKNNATLIRVLREEAAKARKSVASVIELCVDRGWANFEAAWLEDAYPKPAQTNPAAFKLFEKPVQNGRVDRNFGIKQIGEMLNQLGR